VSDDRDEPLEGDIGPASVASSEDAASLKHAASPEETEGERESPDEELRRYELEREERRRRNNALAGRIAVLLTALLLAFLAYDGITNAVKAHDKGDSWIYPPGTVALACLLGLAGLGLWALRRRR
jgi:hypothetical protein